MQSIREVWFSSTATDKLVEDLVQIVHPLISKHHTQYLPSVKLFNPFPCTLNRGVHLPPTLYQPIDESQVSCVSPEV